MKPKCGYDMNKCRMNVKSSEYCKIFCGIGVDEKDKLLGKNESDVDSVLEVEFDWL